MENVTFFSIYKLRWHVYNGLVHVFVVLVLIQDKFVD